MGIPKIFGSLAIKSLEGKHLNPEYSLMFNWQRVQLTQHRLNMYNLWGPSEDRVTGFWTS